MASSCFRGCLLRIPYATILSTLISTCGLIIGLAALFDATNTLERIAYDILLKNYLILNDLKIGYVFGALFIVIVIIFNLIVGFIATDKSLYDIERSPSRRRRNCCSAPCLKSSTAICLLQIFLAFNYIIYYMLLLVTILSFIILYSSLVTWQLCKDAPIINSVIHNVPTSMQGENDKMLDLRQFSRLFGLQSNETYLLLFQEKRYQRFCLGYIGDLLFYVSLCTIGFVLACAGFVNYLMNFNVNSAKISTKQKFTEVYFLDNEELPFDTKY